jgi:acetyltransferase-like isoleucine patch superfamily enzyme
MKSVLKTVVRICSAALVLPLALLSGFGRVKPLFLLGAHWVALIPGLIGDYLRVAYYHLTLESCSLDCRVEFGSFFAHPEASVGLGVYIGPYTVLGRVKLGAGSQIASGVQILSGRRQHGRGADGSIEGAEKGEFATVSIGANCWIGASAVVMADVGEGTTVGAGAVVVKALPAGVVAVGNPARILETPAS